LRATWDYARRYDAFLAWAERVASASRLVNPLDVVRWNTDKHYLAELSRAGIEVVHTDFIEPGGPIELPRHEPLVVKPAISVGAKDTVRYAAGEIAAATAHVEALLATGRSVLVQPYLERVDEVGETALVFFDGSLSHAIRKGPILEEGAPANEQLFAPEDIRPRDPTAAEIVLARRALAAVPKSEQLTYARIDLVPDGDRPVVLEVELTEPSLFLEYSGGGVDRLAEAILRRL
jgi:O-ureido-D-serine cyclo-ligase